MTKLGQNFLISKDIVNRAIDVADVKKSELVLEIGPGKGIFTEKLLESGFNVLAIEKDEELAEGLEERFRESIENDKLKILKKDILDFNFKNLALKTHKSQALDSYKIISNIPFYITGAILKKFLQSKNQPKSMTLIIQKEVGERILAKDGKESILSISVKAYGEPVIIKNVSKKSFKPQPKVDSVILHIDNISKDFFVKNNIDERKFFELVKSGFSSKRKYLKNNLEKYFKNSNSDLSKKLNQKRAEELTLKDWKNLYHSAIL